MAYIEESPVIGLEREGEMWGPITGLLKKEKLPSKFILQLPHCGCQRKKFRLPIKHFNYGKTVTWS